MRGNFELLYSTGKVYIKKIRKFTVLKLILFLALVGTSSGAGFGPLPASGNAYLDAPKAIPFDIVALKKN